MKNRTKLLLSVGVVGAIGVLLAVGTSAFFSASATSGVNVAATGTMTLSSSDTVIFNSGAPDNDGLMTPQTSLANARTNNRRVQGTTTITTTGTLAQAVTLTQLQIGGTGYGGGTGFVMPGSRPALFKKAQLCITQTAPAGGDCGVYNGNLDMLPASPDDTGDAVASTPLALATYASGGEARTYRFEVWLPNDVDTDNDYQGQIATAQFRFDGS